VKPSVASRCLLVVCISLAAAVTIRAENWPQWRGPTGDGISSETNLPAEFSETKNLAWKLKLPGKAGSTPIIWNDRIFLTSADGSDVVLLCISTQGKELWKRKLGTGDRAWMRDEANNASPSPSTDGKHVWALDGMGDLACFDFDGTEVWRCNLVERYGAFKQNWGGIHTSPLLDGDRLYLSLLQANGAWVIALDKSTGSEVWKVERKSDAQGESKESYATPVMWRDGKDAYLITHGGDYTIAHRLTDGSEIWRAGDLNPKERYSRAYRFVATPAVSRDLIVIPTAKHGVVVGIRPDAKGMVQAGSMYEVWRKANGTPDVPCPLIHDGLVYLCGEMGGLTCLDAKTGKELYQEKWSPLRHRASPVYADGKIYCIGRDGTVRVVKAGPKYELLATNKLPDEISASPVISNGRLYLRGFGTLYVFAAAK
jgi:outer membrane protein assembly factor BamB